MKKETPGILGKKIADLTPVDMEAIEKTLGTEALPFPMWGTQRVAHNDRVDLEQVLSVIRGLKVYSERPYKEVLALAYCDMPVPSMLPLFRQGLERRHPESTNRTQMMIGDPGHGKSFLGALQGRLRTPSSVEVLDCGGKNMRELLFEMVLDFGAGDALPAAIDKRLAAGTLEPLSQARLKTLPSRALSLDEGGGVKGVDWNHFRGGATPEEVDKAFAVLKEVSVIEGLDRGGGNALGMNSQYGPLIRKWMAGEEIVFDEYNKSREGTDDNLQTVWQFLIGELKDCTVENPLKNKDSASGPAEFTFRREDMKAGFFVTLTGNKKEDGITTRSLNKSVYSRLSPETLPDPDEADWQHRICQMMTGVPVSTLYTVFGDQADASPEAFGAFLLDLRRTRAQVDGARVPELQETLLTNWQGTVAASQKLAKFYHKWAAMTDAEKISLTDPDLMQEVDEEYSKKEGIDFRKIKQHLEEAIPLRPQMQRYDMPVMADFRHWASAPPAAEKTEENPALRFGTRLVEFIENTVYKKSGAVGKNVLYTKLSKAMEECGLRDVSLKEGTRSRQRSVEEDLNVSAFADKDPGRRAETARHALCDYLRQVDPRIEAADDEILTLKRMRDVLTSVGAAQEKGDKSLFFANRDHDSLAAVPLREAVIRDAAVYAMEDREELDFAVEDIVRHDDFLAALALPGVSEKNISSLWEENLRALSARESAAVSGVDAGLDMAENRSAGGIAITTLTLAGDNDNLVPLHVVRNGEKNRTLVVGGKIPSKLKAAFNEAGIAHVDRNAPGAKARVDEALAEVLRGAPRDTAEVMARAFAYRNGPRKGVCDDAETYMAGKGISELLADGKIESFYPKYVVRAPRRAP